MSSSERLRVQWVHVSHCCPRFNIIGCWAHALHLGVFSFFFTIILLQMWMYSLHLNNCIMFVSQLALWSRLGLYCKSSQIKTRRHSHVTAGALGREWWERKIHRLTCHCFFLPFPPGRCGLRLPFRGQSGERRDLWKGLPLRERSLSVHIVCECCSS